MSGYGVLGRSYDGLVCGLMKHRSGCPIFFESKMATKQSKQMMEKLASLALSWGGEIRKVTREEFERMADRQEPEFSSAPFTSYDLGISRSEKLIVYTSDDDVEWGDVIHEMGHTFADLRDLLFDHGVGPMVSEWDFFGWEFVLAKHIGGDMDEWAKSMSEYAVTDLGIEFGTLDAEGQKEVIRERILFAVSGGLIRHEGDALVPLAIR